jgi:hypothetical protein
MRALLAELTDLAVRRGLYDGFILGVFVMALLFVSNIVLPPSFQASSMKDEVGWPLAILVVALFAVIGARGQRRVNTTAAGARAGAAAGLVVAVLFVATFLIMDNLFFATFSQLPYKAGSTPASLTTATLWSMGFFIPVGIFGGALLGQFGGSFVEERMARSGTDA